MGTAPVLFMYIGNLEPYQGIDLLIESMAQLSKRRPGDRLAIVGGMEAQIRRYRRLASKLAIAPAVDFRGPRPTAELPDLFREADVLVSPRTRGSNTPMKIYSYLDSGKPIVATDLFTHTQVLTPEVAMLAAPDPDAFADAMHALARDPGLRSALGVRGRQLARTRYSAAAFARSLDEIYGYIGSRLRSGPPNAREG